LRPRSSKTTTHAAHLAGALAPFGVVLVPINLQKSERVRAASDGLCRVGCGRFEVLFDDPTRARA